MSNRGLRLIFSVFAFVFQKGGLVYNRRRINVSDERKDILTVTIEDTAPLVNAVRKFMSEVEPYVAPNSSSFTSVDEFISWAKDIYEREGWKPNELHFSLNDLTSNFGINNDI